MVFCRLRSWLAGFRRIDGEEVTGKIVSEKEQQGEAGEYSFTGRGTTTCELVQVERQQVSVVGRQGVADGELSLSSRVINSRGRKDVFLER